MNELFVHAAGSLDEEKKPVVALSVGENSVALKPEQARALAGSLMAHAAFSERKADQARGIR